MAELFLQWLQQFMDFSTILNVSIAASWMVLAVFLLRFALKKAPKWVHVLLWGLVAVRLLMPFSIESSFSLIPSVQTVPQEILRYQGTQLSQPAYIDIVTNPNLLGDVSIQLGQTVDRVQWRMVYMTFVWLGGMAVMLLYAVASYWWLHRKVSTAVRYKDNIYQSENVPSPFVLGILRPQIYIPFSIKQQDIPHVVAHENAHIQRKDHWWKPLGFVLLAIHWFNPVMWLAYTLLCRDIELACDEKVIRNLKNEQRADYSQALVDCSVNRRIIAACPLAFGEVSVKERVKSVMHYIKPVFWVVLISVVASIIVAICFLTNPKSNDSWIKPVKDSQLVEFECNFTLPIKSYAIYEDIYENGKLISSTILICDNFQEDGGASPRKMNLSLYPQSTPDESGGFTGELSLTYKGAGTAQLTRKLPKKHYTGSGYFANKMENMPFHKQKLEENGSVNLLTVIYSTDPTGNITVTNDNTSVQYNDTVLIYRLVTSENKEISEQAYQTIQIPSKEHFETDKISIEGFDAGMTVYISGEEADSITHILSSAQWTEGTADCMSDFKITVGNNEYLYHLSCGTINDNKNNRSVTLSEEQRNTVEQMLWDNKLLYVTHYPANKGMYLATPQWQTDYLWEKEEFIITKSHFLSVYDEWMCEDYKYKYRLEITGKRDMDTHNTTYIVLSNTENITFNQVWKASGFSSNTADYFDPADAVIVGYRLFS